ncbi:MAG: hypothetical protein PHT02_00240 [Tissierellia bacterium]|nr:hypothetical protein [Tissierellia bacterium]
MNRTLQNLERLQLREMDADYSLNLIENYHYEKLPYSWIDIINYTYKKCRENCCRLRIKELFIQEELQEKVDKILTEDINRTLNNDENIE